MAIYNYEIKTLNAERVRVLYDGEIICKFDRTEEAFEEMIESILDWAWEDGTIKSHDRKKVFCGWFIKAMATFKVEIEK